MPRPALASAIHELRGTYKVNPERRRLKEPEVSGEFDITPPKGLAKDEKECWKEIVESAPKLVLTKCDRILVESTAVLVAEFRRLKCDQTAARLNRMIYNLGLLGMTPSDRTKLQVEKPKKNEFDDL